jgi:hypothetical protein
VLELYTSGAIGDDMDEFAPWRFAFDIVYLVFMEIMFQNIVGGLMIDSFSELKEEDNARFEDKFNFCYICSMDKAAVHFILFRWKEQDQPSQNTLTNVISFGTISIISIVSV